MRLGDVLPPEPATYGEETAFARGSRLVYPDFSVEFLGTTRDLPFTAWRFEIVSESETVELQYGTGGVRDAARFTVGDRAFVLDLLQLDLEESRTLVITPLDTNA